MATATAVRESGASEPARRGWPWQIPLYRRKSVHGRWVYVVVGATLVDRADYERYADFGPASAHWCMGNGYAVQVHGRRVGEFFRLHRLILGLDHGDPREGDHINGDRLDNRQANLRIVTGRQNKQNQPVNRCSGRTSRFRGVCRTSDGAWQAQIWLDGRNVHLGRFATEEEAARVATAARAEHFSHFNPNREGASVGA